MRSRNLIILGCAVTALALLLVACKGKQAIVTAESGLVLREQPAASAGKILTLIKNTNILVVKKGPEGVADGKKERWYKVEFGDKTGWVFGGYISREIPTGLRVAHEFVSRGNGTANIYLNLYRNGQLDLYFESLISEKPEVLIGKGSWRKEKGKLIITFNQKQACSPDCELKYLFVNSDGSKYDSDIEMLDDYTFTFPESVSGIAIWGVLCKKFLTNPS